jgi:zinc protease
MPGVPRSTPDYVALEVMNRVLGGLFSSRLNMNLREAHGYTYGAFSGAQYGRTTGFFTSGAAIRSDATAPGLQEMLSELERIRTVPPSADELRLAQGSYALSLAGQFETTWSSSSALGELYVFDLSLDYYATLPAQINAITSAQAQAAAQKYLAPAARKIIIVGDRKGVEPPLRALGVGAVDVVE